LTATHSATYSSVSFSGAEVGVLNGGSFFEGFKLLHIETAFALALLVASVSRKIKRLMKTEGTTINTYFQERMLHICRKRFDILI
jgi:hypothetical protein